MAKGLALPRSFRGTGDLRVALERNWKHTISHMNTYLVGVDEPGQLTVSGFDLRLGAHDQTTRGDSGSSRALVKADGYLGVNWAGDFGFTRIYNGSNDYFQVGTTGGVNGTFLIADGVQIHSVDANGAVKVYNSFGDFGGHISNVNSSGRKLIRMQAEDNKAQVIAYSTNDTLYPGDLTFYGGDGFEHLRWDHSADEWVVSDPMRHLSYIRTGNINFYSYGPNWGTEYSGSGGGAAIVNDNGTYNALMILGNTAGGGQRLIKMWDDVIINSDLTVADNIYMGGSTPSNDYFFYDTGNSQFKWYNNGAVKTVIGTSAAIAPGSDDALSCGATNLRFTVVYATTGTINTSDPSLKDDMVDSDLGLDFVKSVRPIRYKWKDGVRPHYGFDAAQVKAVIDARGVDFAGFIDPTINPDVEPDGEPGNRPLPLGLRYSEFIAPAYQAIRELDARLTALEAA